MNEATKEACTLSALGHHIAAHRRDNKGKDPQVMLAGPDGKMVPARAKIVPVEGMDNAVTIEVLGADMSAKPTKPK